MSSPIVFVPPVINNELLKQILEQCILLEQVPSCPVLEKYFKDHIISESTKLKFSPSEFNEIKSIFPDLPTYIQQSNLNSIIMYYVIHYPAFPLLRERYESLLEKIRDNVLDEATLFNNWYKEFYCYLKLKLNKTPELLSTQLKDANTLTNISKLNEPHVSEVCLEIFGPTNIINNLVFSTVGDNVQVRYHKNVQGETFSNETGLKSLLNYPNIQVKFNFATLKPCLVFTRSCECAYNRFIVNKYTPAKKKIFEAHLKPKGPKSKVDGKVQSVELVDARESDAYSYGFLFAYVSQLFDLINKCSEKVSPIRKQELTLLLNELLADVREVNLHKRMVIATNTAMKYRIGATTYERHRFITKSDINFIELLKPIITLHFEEFNPIYSIDGLNNIFFKQLRFFEQNLAAFEDVLLDDKMLTFTCLLCKSPFKDSSSIMDHFHEMHEPEVGVVCECQLSIDVAALAANRWSHNCFE